MNKTSCSLTGQPSYPDGEKQLYNNYIVSMVNVVVAIEYYNLKNLACILWSTMSHSVMLFTFH